MKIRMSLTLALLALSGAASAQQQQAEQQRQQQEMNRLGDEALRNGQGQSGGYNIPRRVEEIPMMYGAIAVNDALDFGTAISNVYYDAARKDAVEACDKTETTGKGCYSHITFSNGCMAIVAGVIPEKNDKLDHWFDGSSNTSIEEAIGHAIMGCFDYTYTGTPHQCRMVTARCATPETKVKKKGFWSW